eukprot:993512-Pelagomonas_calceolata.AAC.2
MRSQRARRVSLPDSCFYSAAQHASHEATTSWWIGTRGPLFCLAHALLSGACDNSSLILCLNAGVLAAHPDARDVRDRIQEGLETGEEVHHKPEYHCPDFERMQGMPEFLGSCLPDSTPVSAPVCHDTITLLSALLSVMT